jgi:ppGpp synthetase/RelA/SpoT-type nucleotidyltranferase
VDRETQEKVWRLVREFFPWGEQGYPQIPFPDSPQAREETAKRWLREYTRQFRGVALTLIARMIPILYELENSLRHTEGSRLFARIDASALLKRPESILEKMVRDWDGIRTPKASFRSLGDKVDDIGRFRIVANFLSDVEMISRALELPYGSSTLALSPPQRALMNEYQLRGNQLRDTIHVQPEERKRGERCRKGIFHPRDPALDYLKVEVQIQTLLQEAWDKKDHFLIYEPRRRGERLDPRHIMEIFAMSELLYVADLTFDRLKQAILDSRDK